MRKARRSVKRCQAPTAAGDSTGGTGEPNLRVGAGDLLAVTVFDMPELTQNVRVNDVGDASFAFIGLLHVAGLTPDQTREAIASSLRDGNFVLHPQVSVLIQEYGTQGVSVLGQVQKPGVYPVLGSRTLLDVISQAGGTTTLAGSSVTIKRHADGAILTIPLTRNAEQSLASDVQLLPGDKVIIPQGQPDLRDWRCGPARRFCHGKRWQDDRTSSCGPGRRPNANGRNAAT